MSFSEIRKKLYIQNEYGVEHQDPDASLPPEDVKYLKDKYDIMTDVHRTCISCQARQIIKYNEAFQIPCKGIPRALPPGSSTMVKKLIAELDISLERAKLIARSTVDPVAWAELMFGFSDDKPTWHLRNYQKEQLRCSSRKMVLREGRRSGKTFIIALKLVHLLFNHLIQRGYDQNGEPIYQGPEIMIITPYQSQILNIFDEIEGLLKQNVDLKKVVTTGSGDSLYVKTPFFHLDVENGGTIKGFVSGVGNKIDGSGGGTMRGQNAHIIYLDEMDMIPDEILEKTVMPILLTDLTGDVILLGTSTPIGKRGKFYTFCKEDVTFKEDHLPSTVLPQWNRVKSTLEPPNSTKESFDAEYMALFIEGSYGVFKPSLIRTARREYTYRDTQRPGWFRENAGVLHYHDMVKCIGIDWNKNAGTEFVVTGYDPHSHKYIVLEAVNMTASEFSAARWKEEVIRLNHKWKPDYIYADEGYGHHIIEDLKLLAHSLKGSAKTPREVETSKLYERLVAFNFSQKIELRSPIDGTTIKKSGKEYLVENAVRIFEDQIIWYPVEDLELFKQLQHYVVLRRTPTTNKPIYGADNAEVGDHRLDALMLSLAGLQLEFGQFSDRGALALSAPKMFTKQDLQKRSQQPSQSFARRQGGTGLGALEILGPMDQTEFLKRTQDEKETGVRGRKRSNMKTEGTSVREAVLERAEDYRGYSNDTEHLYKREKQPGMRKRKRSRRRSLFKR